MPDVPEPPPIAAKDRTKRAEPSPRVRKARLGTLQTLGWIGIFGVGAAVGAILGSFDVRGWIIGIAVSGATVLLGFALHRSTRL